MRSISRNCSRPYPFSARLSRSALRVSGWLHSVRMMEAAERIVVLIEAASAGLRPFDVVLVEDELHHLMVALDALPLDLVLAMDRLGLG